MSAKKIFIAAIQDIDSRTYELAQVTILGAYTSLKIAMSKIMNIADNHYDYAVVYEVPIYKDNEGFDIYNPDVIIHLKDTDKL